MKKRMKERNETKSDGWISWDECQGRKPIEEDFLLLPTFLPLVWSVLLSHGVGKSGCGGRRLIWVPSLLVTSLMTCSVMFIRRTRERRERLLRELAAIAMDVLYYL